ncbi:MAG: hypothetical protein RR404_02075, partial [Bacilli bacterium]
IKKEEPVKKEEPIKKENQLVIEKTNTKYQEIFVPNTGLKEVKEIKLNEIMASFILGFGYLIIKYAKK